jgi:hypothetical protein
MNAQAGAFIPGGGSGDVAATEHMYYPNGDEGNVDDGGVDDFSDYMVS